MPVDSASQEPILDGHEPSLPGEGVSWSRTKSRDDTAELIMDILIRGGDGVGPVGDVDVIAGACGLSVARVRQRIAELSMTPSAPATTILVRPACINDVSTNGDQAPLIVGADLIKKKINGTAPPLAFLDTLSQGQREVIFAHFGHDGTAFDKAPRKSVKIIAAEREVEDQAVYALLNKGLEKLWSEKRPVQKRRGRKPGPGASSKARTSSGSGQKKREISDTSSVCPILPGIPLEETPETYEALLKWMREPKQEKLLEGFEDARKKCRHDARYRGDDGLSERILEKFPPGYLGRQVLLLARYLNSATFLQEFIHEVRNPRSVKDDVKVEMSGEPEGPDIQRSEATILPTTQPVQRPVLVPETSEPEPFHRKDFIPRPRPSRSHPFVATSFLSPRLTSPTPPPVGEKKEAICPDFVRSEQAIEWLKKQTQWSEFYRKALETKKDSELSLFLTTNCIGLLNILLTIKTKFTDYPTIRDILCAVRPPVQREKELSSPPPEEKLLEEPPVAAASLEAAETEETLHLSKAHEAEIKRIFDLHQAGKYREFWAAIQSISRSDTMAELLEVQEFIQGQHFIDAIAFIGGEKIDKNLYVKHQCNSRISQLPYVKTQGKRLLEHKEANKMKVIKELIGTIEIKIPAIITKDQEWMGFDELAAPKSNLLAIIQVLIKLDGDDPESTKKILRKLKQILGIPLEVKKA